MYPHPNRYTPGSPRVSQPTRRYKTQPALHIAQINMRHSRQVSAEISQLMNSGKVDIVLAQEPYNCRGKITGLGSQNLILTGTANDEYPQAAIFLKGGTFTTLKLSHLSDSHTVCAEVTSPCGQFYLVSSYFQYACEIVSGLAALQRIIDALQGKPVILCIDSNARSSLWDSIRPSNFRRLRAFRRGRRVENFIIQNGLAVANSPGHPPTYRSHNGDSNIDITLMTPAAKNLVTTWHVQDDATTSDHNLIRFDIRSNLPTPITRQPLPGRFNCHKANWDRFCEEFERLLREDEPPTELDCREDAQKAILHLENAILKASELSIPRKKWHARATPGWTPALTQLKKATCKLRRTYQRERDPASRETKRHAYSESLRKYRSLYRSSAKSAWRDLVSKCGQENPWSVPYRSVFGKNIPITAISSVRTTDRHTTSWSESANALLTALCPDDSAPDSESQKITRRKYTDPVQTDNAPEFDFQSLSRIIRNLGNNRSPGPDGIEVPALKMAFCQHPNAFLNIFNAALKHGLFSTSWKTGKIRAILKSPDKPEDEPSSYRPICLLPVLGKVMEKLLTTRLTETLYSPEHASPSQYGFKAGSGTDDALHKLQSIVGSLATKHAIAISFDIKGAFDNVWWPAVTAELRNRECPQNVYNVLLDYFRDRKVILRSEFLTVTKNVTKGCPQGSVLGPSIWILLFDTLLNRLAAVDRTHSVAYADDLLVIVEGNSRSSLETTAAAAVGVIQSWCSDYKLQLSAHKTQMLQVRGTLDIDRPPRIRIQDTALQYASCLRYLGIMYGRHLTVSEHVEYISARAKQRFFNLSGLAGSKWGYGFRARSLLYNAIFESIATYGATGWAHRLSRSRIAALNSAQRFALISVTAAYRTISTDALCVISNQIPLDLVLSEKRHRFFVRKLIPFSHNGIEFAPSADEDPATHKAETLNALRENTIHQWEQRWIASTKGRITFQFFPSIAHRASSPMPVNHYTTQLLSGHGNFRGRLHQLGLARSPECACGEDAESALHILLDCSLLREERAPLITAVEGMGHQWPPPLPLFTGPELCMKFNTFAYSVLQRRERQPARPET